MRLRLMSGFVCTLLTFGGLPTATGAQDRTAENAARNQQIRDARATLGKLLGAGVEGRLFERIPGSYVFSPGPAGLPQAVVANPGAIAVFAVGPLVVVRGSLDQQGRINVASINLAPNETPAPAAVAAATRTLRASLDKALKPGAMSVASRTLDDPSPIAVTARKSVAEIRVAYQQAVAKGDQKQILEIVREWARVRTTIADFFPEGQDFKALYGPPDNYEPWRYDIIFRQSAAVVAIGVAGGNPPSRCSGVLISEDLVLTAGHCLGSDDTLPTDLEIWFDYARAPNGTVPQFSRRPVVELVAPSPARLADIKAGAFDADLLDYAILRFGALQGEPSVPNKATPQCLRPRPLQTSDPVYVIGYPRGEPVMVHDSARVYLPYRVMNGEQFTQLRMNVDADLLDSPQRLSSIEEFDRSYATIRKEGGLSFRFFHHVKDNGQPRMGIISDTFKGNSGGPVYDRENRQCVVGVFVAGAPDTGERLVATWKQHEEVLPIGAVLDDAERHAPGIKAKVTLDLK